MNLSFAAKKQSSTKASNNPVAWISVQAKLQGPVFQLPSVHPTYAFVGIDALSVFENSNLVKRTTTQFPFLHAALNDENVEVLMAAHGDEHKRRRASWQSPGGLDQDGITNLLPSIEDAIDSSFLQWEKKRIFSLNMEARQLAWKIATRVVLGHQGDLQILEDFEKLIGLNTDCNQIREKQRVLDWLEAEAEAVRQMGINGPGGSKTCIAEKLAKSDLLSHDELMNEIKHGLIAALGLWLPMVELLRRLTKDEETMAALRNEIESSGDYNGLSLSNMTKTPHLIGLIKDTLHWAPPTPVCYAQAKTSFNTKESSIEKDRGVTIPNNAVLIGALQASDLPFGFGSHRCPAANLTMVALWSFAVKFLAGYHVVMLDPNDMPIWQDNKGFFSSRGCFVKFSSISMVSKPRLAPCCDNTGDKFSSSTSCRFLAGTLKTSDRTCRIAIVGAGITGLTLANELRKCGYKNITVFERASSIGGKADTVDIDGRPYNLGAYLCHGNLGVASLAREVGVTMARAPTYVVWDIDNNRPIPPSYKHFTQVQRLRQLLTENPELDDAAGFAVMESWTFPSISTWLEAYGYGDLREIGPFFTGAGYGFMEDDIPAALFLKFAQHMTEEVWTPSGGYKRLLERVSEGLNVRCGTEVVKVERDCGCDHSILPQTIRITTSDADDVDCEEFDRLILASPLEHAERFLDLSHEEQSLFSRIRSLDYCTVLATVDIEQPHEPGLHIVHKNTTTDAKRNGRITAFVRTFEESKVYLFFCYAEPGQSEDSILTNVRDDVRMLGGEITKLHSFRKWAYAPHVSPHDMALGFHRRLDRLQGRLGTYYAGSLLAFELTDHNVLQAKSLVDRFFKDQGTVQATEIDMETRIIDTSLNPCWRSNHTRVNNSIIDILRQRYECTPDSIFSTFLDAEGKILRTLTYKVLTEQAMACAASLKAKGVTTGDRVALVYPPDTDEFLIGFFGCLLASAVAVPVACPDPRKLDAEIPRFAHLMNDCDCQVALTTRLYRIVALVGQTWNRITSNGSDRATRWPKLTWVSTDGLLPLVPSSGMPVPSPEADSTAYLQYTSGSTSDPKGVMITHANILHNTDSIRRQTCVDEKSVLLGWVPLFHGMGLVGGPLTALFCGAHMVFFSPMSFLQNPVLWIKAISQYRATHTVSPNFGYEFLLRNIEVKSSNGEEPLRGIDLSCLSHVLFGGEAMQHRTFERLAERLHCIGLRAEAMTNIFGAAEATLFLAGGGLDSTPLLSVDTQSLETKRRAKPCSPNLRSTTTLIGCGIASFNSDLRIVDPSSTRLLPDGEVGEIWLSSPSVSKGYWGRSSMENDLIFRARVAGDPAPLRTYLRTGDLGFTERGILYICGRLNEMMIFNGRNIHPADIELCVMNAHSAIRQGCVVAFSVEDEGEERLIIVAEIKKMNQADASAATESMAREVLCQYKLVSRVILLVPGGTLPKTSSGKLQRHRTRQMYLSGDLEPLHTVTSNQAVSIDFSTSEGEATVDAAQLSNEAFTGDVFATRQWLQRLIASLLHVAPGDVSTSTSFSSFGIDSTEVMSMTARISAFTGFQHAPSVLYEQSSIDALALYLCSKEAASKQALVRLQQGNPKKFPKLFCVHPVGGSAMAYLGLVEALHEQVPVSAFCNENNVAPVGDLVAMARYYITEMHAEQSSGPYFLLGYSFGGTVAYEMARQLMSRGYELGGLFVIDSPAPIYQDSQLEPLSLEQGTYSKFLETAILNHLIPDQLGDEEREKLRLRVEENNGALSRYRIDSKDSVHPRLTMFRARDEAPHLRSSLCHPAFDCPDFGWEEAAPGSVSEVVHVPGDHFSVMNEPDLLAEMLMKRLKPKN